MKETSKNNKFGIGEFMIRLLVFGLMWLGALYLFTTIFDTNWPLWSDIIGSLGLVWLPMHNNEFYKWFFNRNH